MIAEYPKQVKTLLHHILLKHKVYHLSRQSLVELTYLLRQDYQQDAVKLQEAIFNGIFQHNKKYDRIGESLQNNNFSAISFDTKQLLHKILHQYNFLYSIKAYEMFNMPVNDASDTQQNQPVKSPILNDQYEKMKLQQMYFGPMSMYFPPTPPQKPPSSLLPAYSSRYYANYAKKYTYGENIQEQSNFLLNFRKQRSNYDILNNDRKNYVGRGRPSKDKNRLIRQSFEKQSNKYYEELKNCVCKGYINNSTSFQCIKCKKRFHNICMKQDHISKVQCIWCRMQKDNPFLMNLQNFGKFYLNDISMSSFQEQINFELYKLFYKSNKVEVLVSCAKIEKNDQRSSDIITWPDNCLFKLNNELIFEVPALEKNHFTKRRKDKSYFITNDLLERKFVTNFDEQQKVKLKILIKNEQNQPKNQKIQKLNNTNQTFAFGIYLVQKITVDQFVNKVIQNNQQMLLKSPFEQIQDEEVFIDKILISLEDIYTSRPIQIPVKGQKCSHFQCFDLKIFAQLMKNAEYADWKCPFCRKDARNLVIDRIQLKIIQQVENYITFPKTIVLFRNGRIEILPAGIDYEPSVSEGSQQYRNSEFQV